MAARTPFNALQTFNSYARATRLQGLNKELLDLSAATNGAVRFETRPLPGDTFSEDVWKRSGAGRFRNVKDTAAITKKNYGQERQVSPKVGYAFGPVQTDEDIFSWQGYQVAAAASLYGEELQQEDISMTMQTVIGSLIGALSATAGANLNRVGTKKDKSENKKLDLKAFLDASFLLGDASGMLRAWLMHSASAHQFIGANLASYERIFTGRLLAGVNVYSDPITGRPLIITDDSSFQYKPTLETSDVTGGYRVLGLLENAISVYDQADDRTNIDTSNGNTNIEDTRQSQWSKIVSVRGYSYKGSVASATPLLDDLKKVGTGGGATKNGSTAATATSSNWVVVPGTSVKDRAGVMISHFA